MSINNDLVQLLSERLLTISTAESCTGGLISKLLTDVPGSSSVFMGSVCTYSNKAKTDILNVKEDDLLTYGAVSEPVALQMARGAKRLFGTDITISTTGIAGPSSDETKKPVGLVYIAVAVNEGRYITRELHLSGSREEIRNATADAAIALAMEVAEGL